MRFDLKDKNIWQVGSGDASRPYEDICLEYGIATVSPGSPGKAGSPEADAYYKKTGYKDWGKALANLRQGDLVVLRKGTKRIIAVGKVAGDYDYTVFLSDIHGWDSQHYIKVDWYLPVSEIDLGNLQMAYATLTRLNNQPIVDKIAAADFHPYTGSKKSFSDLVEPNRISIEDVAEALIENGLRIQDAENVSETIRRVIRLAKWYRDNDYDVLEHEIRTFLVIPLLISLGWSEQKIKIEYNRIDIALFDRPYTKNIQPKEPYMIIETKCFDDGLYQAREQAHKYAAGYKSCDRLLLTNGYIYKLYEKVNDEFEERGYLNLLDMREHHYLDSNIEGAIHVLLKMSGFKLS
ncbi:MAG: hypothetical protein ABRQ24_03920 [Syntrophomonadaceae bacterium]